MKIYTKRGDGGQTQLFGQCQLVSKAATQVAAYGDIDELNAWLGHLYAQIQSDGKICDKKDVETFLHASQEVLFCIGSRLACGDTNQLSTLPKIEEIHIKKLETWIDQWSEVLPPQRHFILPGGHPLAGIAGVARTVCRRAERSLVIWSERTKDDQYPLILQFLNRLSDALHVFSRWLNYTLQHQEIFWKPRK